MTTWYSKVKVWDRFDPPSIHKREVELDGWMDNIDVALFLIGTYRDDRDEIDFSDPDSMNMEEFKHDHFSEPQGYDVDKEKHSASCMDEEWRSGVANDPALCEKRYFETVEEECSYGEQEW